jgi:hypothetical protein
MWNHYESTVHNDSPLSTGVLCAVCAANHYPCVTVTCTSGYKAPYPRVRSARRDLLHSVYIQRFVTVGHLQRCFLTSSLKHDGFIHYSCSMLQVCLSSIIASFYPGNICLWRWCYLGNISNIFISIGMATYTEVRFRFPAIPDFLRNNGSGTEFTQSWEYNWGATWKKK